MESGVPVLAGRSIRLWGSGSTTGVGKSSQIWIGDELGAEMDDFGDKIAEISWMEGGETWGDARST